MLTFAITVGAMLMLSPVNGEYNLIIALLPLAVASTQIQGRDVVRAAWFMAAAILLSLPVDFSPWLRIAPLFSRMGWGTLLAAGPLYGLLALWALLLVLCLESARLARRPVSDWPR
jgi:hypothetical protein